MWLYQFKTIFPKADFVVDTYAYTRANCFIFAIVCLLGFVAEFCKEKERIGWVEFLSIGRYD